MKPPRISFLNGLRSLVSDNIAPVVALALFHCADPLLVFLSFCGCPLPASFAWWSFMDLRDIIIITSSYCEAWALDVGNQCSFRTHWSMCVLETYFLVINIPLLRPQLAFIDGQHAVVHHPSDQWLLLMRVLDYISLHKFAIIQLLVGGGPTKQSEQQIAVPFPALC